MWLQENDKTFQESWLWANQQLLQKLSKAHIANLDAMQSFVFGLKRRFCKYRTLIGQHFCQAFLQKDKIVRASQLWSHRSYMFPHLTSDCSVHLQSQ